VPESLSSLRSGLTADPTRQLQGFSEDIEKAHRVLHNPLAQDYERQRAMELWLFGRDTQPCVFGKIAARQQKMHFCFITAADIGNSDNHVRDKIASARSLWKRRAASGIPEHGFMLVVCDKDVAYAKANEDLKKFAEHLQCLVGWRCREGERGNDISDEWLYLRHPETKEIIKFTFSVDFFASAGDSGWWHDHRVPGGIAFTANSLGHMAKYLEWYEKKDLRIEWALRNAMNTIDSAAKEHPHRPATYLIDLENGEPVSNYPRTSGTPIA
jgi:hypothetical protein